MVSSFERRGKRVQQKVPVEFTALKSMQGFLERRPAARTRLVYQPENYGVIKLFAGEGGGGKAKNRAKICHSRRPRLLPSISFVSGYPILPGGSSFFIMGDTLLWRPQNLVDIIFAGTWFPYYTRGEKTPRLLIQLLQRTRKVRGCLTRIFLFFWRLQWYQFSGDLL